MVRALPRVGDDEPTAQLLPYAARLAAVLTQWMRDIWRNRILFWGIVAGFVLAFPSLYIPVVNHSVFKHSSISWEWGIVFVETVLFFLGIEAWKWCKRVYYRRQAFKAKKDGKNAPRSERGLGEFSRHTTMSWAETRAGGDFRCETQELANTLTN